MIASRSVLGTITIPAAVIFILTGGWGAVGDGGSSKMMYLGTTAPSPVRLWHASDNGGGWWQTFVDTDTIDPRQLGFKTDAIWNGDWAGTDNATALQAAIDFTAMNGGGTIKLPVGCGYVGRQVSTVSGVTIEGHSCGMQFAGYTPYPTVGASWLVYPNNYSGTAIAHRSKSPITLKNFGIIMPGGSPNADHIFVDNFVQGDQATYVPNMKTVIDNMFLYGGGIGIRLFNAAAYDVNRCFIFGFVSCGIQLKNDGSGTPYPIIDSGDARIRNCNLQNFAQAVSGSYCIVIQTQGGLWITDCKLLGAQISVLYQASATATNPDGSPANETGEVHIRGLNAEAFSINCIRVEQTKQGARFGGLNIDNFHMNGGSVNAGPGGIQAQGAVVIVPSPWGENYVERGCMTDGNILYGNAVPGSSAVNVGAGFGFIVDNVEFNAQGDCHAVTTNNQAQKTIVRNCSHPALHTAPMGATTTDTIAVNNNW